MVRNYCKKKHETKDDLCPECVEFLNYAFLRLDKCPFQEKKSTYGKCKVHCYRPDMREKAKIIMRYSEPRMLLNHPSLALHQVCGMAVGSRRRLARKLDGLSRPLKF